MGTNKLVRPFLKWAGGKRQLVADIQANMPKKYNTYYEPFVGGGALFLELQRKRVVINDSNSELINCYQVIRDSLDELIEELKKHKSHQHESEYYYSIRGWDRTLLYQEKSPVERAARIIFLNKTCYNGLFRVNSQGQFNVPFGKYKNPNILDETVLKAVNKYLNENSVTILNGDFEKAVEEAKKDDFVYFDPPYDPVSDTASFTG
ncbi:MAG: Dam family site-specific DNA-(adenine-N6)-methyltransferase, partial [Leptolyngbyaceae bacterium]|nr:Dam family site-specific DNA-(adenine-N6)-methyltransferase [Leptolyngbyaceae bacterium]